MSGKSSNAVATIDDKELANYGYDDTGEGGFEEADSDAFAIPQLKILQKMSPQVDEEAPEYVEGAKPGMFLNTATGKLYAKEGELRVVPCHFRNVFLEWTLREDGGGFVAEYTKEEGMAMMGTTSRDDKNRDILPNGHELKDTRIHYVLVINEDGTADPAVFSVTRTQISESKNWMNKMRSRRLPNGRGAAMYAQLFDLSTVQKSNDQGTWSVFKTGNSELIFEVLENHADVFQAAKSFRDMIKSGATTIEHADETAAEAAPAADTGASAGVDEDEVF